MFSGDGAAVEATGGWPAAIDDETDDVTDVVAWTPGGGACTSGTSTS